MTLLKRPIVTAIAALAVLMPAFMSACASTQTSSQSSHPSAIIPITTDSELQIIETAFQDAMNTASRENMSTPETARLNALTALALRESYHYAQYGGGVMLSQSLPQTVGAPELMTEAVYLVQANATGHPLPQATALSHHVANGILALFAPNAVISDTSRTVYSEDTWTPPRAFNTPPALPAIDQALPLKLRSANQFTPQFTSTANDSVPTQTPSAQSRARSLLALNQFAAENAAIEMRLDALAALNITLYDAALAAADADLDGDEALNSAALYVLTQQGPAPDICQSPVHPPLCSPNLESSSTPSHVLGRNVARYVLSTLK